MPSGRKKGKKSIKKVLKVAERKGDGEKKQVGQDSGAWSDLAGPCASQKACKNSWKAGEQGSDCYDLFLWWGQRRNKVCGNLLMPNPEWTIGYPGSIGWQEELP